MRTLEVWRSPAASDLAVDAAPVERFSVRSKDLLHGVDGLVTGGTLGHRAPLTCHPLKVTTFHLSYPLTLP